MDTATLYDDDIVTWSERQAAALRALAARPELSNAVDWDNVIEEIECLGRSEWKGVASQIRNALARILKGYCDSELSLACRGRSRRAPRFATPARISVHPRARTLIWTWSCTMHSGRPPMPRRPTGSSSRPESLSAAPSRWTRSWTKPSLTTPPCTSYMSPSI